MLRNSPVNTASVYFACRPLYFRLRQIWSIPKIRSRDRPLRGFRLRWDYCSAGILLRLGLEINKGSAEDVFAFTYEMLLGYISKSPDSSLIIAYDSIRHCFSLLSKSFTSFYLLFITSRTIITVFENKNWIAIKIHLWRILSYDTKIWRYFNSAELRELGALTTAQRLRNITVFFKKILIPLRETEKS